MILCLRWPGFSTFFISVESTSPCDHFAVIMAENTMQPPTPANDGIEDNSNIPSSCHGEPRHNGMGEASASILQNQPTPQYFQAHQSQGMGAIDIPGPGWPFSTGSSLWDPKTGIYNSWPRTTTSMKGQPALVYPNLHIIPAMSFLPSQPIIAGSPNTNAPLKHFSNQAHMITAFGGHIEETCEGAQANFRRSMATPSSDYRWNQPSPANSAHMPSFNHVSSLQPPAPPISHCKHSTRDKYNISPCGISMTKTRIYVAQSKPSDREAQKRTPTVPKKLLSVLKLLLHELKLPQVGLMLLKIQFFIILRRLIVMFLRLKVEDLPVKTKYIHVRMKMKTKFRSLLTPKLRRS